jgi:hypothetical protein
VAFQVYITKEIVEKRFSTISLLIKTSAYIHFAIFASFAKLKSSEIHLFLLVGLGLSREWGWALAENLSAWVRTSLDGLRYQPVGTYLNEM